MILLNLSREDRRVLSCLLLMATRPSRLAEMGFKPGDPAFRVAMSVVSALQEQINPDTDAVSEAQLAALSRSLITVGERLEAKESDDWLAVARAAALLDGLRIGVVTLPEVCHA